MKSFLCILEILMRSKWMLFSAVAPAAQWQEGETASSFIFIQVLQYFHFAVELQ